MEPWHILVVSSLSNARQLQHNQYVVHKIPSRLYEGKTVAEFRKTLSLRFSSLIREEKKSLPKGMDEASCVLSVHDADSLVKLMSGDNVQEMASDRRLFRIVALVALPVFELLRDIHGPIPEFSPEQLEERVGSPLHAGRKRSATSAFGNSPLPANGGAGAPALELPPGLAPAAVPPPPQQELRGPERPAALQQQGAQAPAAPWLGQGQGAQQAAAQAQAQRGRDERGLMARQQPQRGGGATQGRAEQQAPDRRQGPALQQPAGAIPAGQGPPLPQQQQQQQQHQQQAMLGAAGMAPGPAQYGVVPAGAPVGFGGPVAPPPDILQQQMLAEQQLLLEQHLRAQQQGGPAGMPNLPPHLQQGQQAQQHPVHHPQQAQQAALMSEQQAQLELFQRQQAQQAQQHPGYYPPYY